MLSFTVKPRGLWGPNLTSVKVPSECVYDSNEQAQVSDRYPKQTDNLWPLQRWRAKSWNSIQGWGPSFREKEIHSTTSFQSTVNKQANRWRTKQRIRRCCKDWHLQSCWRSVWVWASEIKPNQIVGIHFGRWVCGQPFVSAARFKPTGCSFKIHTQNAIWIMEESEKLLFLPTNIFTNAVCWIWTVRDIFYYVLETLF